MFQKLLQEHFLEVSRHSRGFHGVSGGSLGIFQRLSEDFRVFNGRFKGFRICFKETEFFKMVLKGFRGGGSRWFQR